MRFVAVTIAALLLMPAQAFAGNPLTDLFRYKEPPIPQSADCSALASSMGVPAVWRGEFSGKRYDDLSDREQPYADRGCFENEAACRIWQQQEITVTNGGPIYYTSCRQGAFGS